MKLWTWIFVVLASVCSVAMGKGIEFEHGSFDEALNKAKGEKKLLFVDVYTEWCGPCKKMAKTIFVKQEVGDFFNASFVNYKLDAEDEELNGPEIAEKYEVNGYPTFLFLDGDGKLVTKKMGAMSQDSFLVMAAEVTGADESYFCKAYNAGDHSIKAFLRCYAKKYNDNIKIYRETKDVAILTKITGEYRDYFKTLSNEQLISEDGFRLIKSGLGMSRSQANGAYLIDNYEKFAAVVDRKELAEAAVEANSRAITTMSMRDREKAALWAQDAKGKLSEAYAIVKPDLKDHYQWEMLEIDTMASMRDKNWPAYLAANEAQAELITDEKARNEHLFLISYKLLMFDCTDKEALRGSMKYVVESWQKKKDFGVAVQYAKLLKALDEQEAAGVIIKEAEALIDKEPDSGKREKMTAQLAKLS